MSILFSGDLRAKHGLFFNSFTNTEPHLSPILFPSASFFPLWSFKEAPDWVCFPKSLNYEVNLEVTKSNTYRDQPGKINKCWGWGRNIREWAGLGQTEECTPRKQEMQYRCQLTVAEGAWIAAHLIFKSQKSRSLCSMSQSVNVGHSKTKHFPKAAICNLCFHYWI